MSGLQPGESTRSPPGPSCPGTRCPHHMLVAGCPDLSVTCLPLLRQLIVPPSMTELTANKPHPRASWHMCCLKQRVQKSVMASPIFRLSAVKGPMIFLLVLSALPLLAFDLPSLRSPMARYETGSQHYAPITRPPVVTLPEMDFKVAALPRLVFTGEASLSATLDRTLPANAPAANYLEKNPAHAFRWLGSSTTGGSVGLGRFLVGYGSV